MQSTLLSAVREAIAKVKDASRSLAPVVVVGAPIQVGPAIHGCAVVIHRGAILGVVPKTYLPNYREFYEKRQFAMSTRRDGGRDHAGGRDASPSASTCPSRQPTFPASRSPSKSARTCGRRSRLPPTRRSLAPTSSPISRPPTSRSARRPSATCCACRNRRAPSCGYIYSAAGYGESTTDTAWDGQLAVYELGSKIAESDRFADESALLYADIDVARIVQDRIRNGTFRDAARNHMRRPAPPPHQLHRRPRARCEAAARAAMSTASRSCRTMKRCSIRIASRPTTSRSRACAAGLKSSGVKKAVIGVSGGLDSTQALLVAVRAFDLMGASAPTSSASPCRASRPPKAPSPTPMR